MSSPTPRPHMPTDPAGVGAPPSWLYLTDAARAAAEYGWLIAALPLRQLLPVGDRQPVLVLPGLLADDRSTWTLRRILRDLGYRVHGWRLGRNFGPTAATVTGLQNRLLDLRSRYDSAVSVIGWSLGGIYARTLARDTRIRGAPGHHAWQPDSPCPRKPVPRRPCLRPLRAFACPAKGSAAGVRP